jgi:hypothetical protein
MPKRAKAKAPPTARQPTIPVTIASPWGGADRVERTVDTLEELYRRGRISDRQHQAGARYRWACENVPGRIACALSFEAGASAPGSRMPLPSAFAAAELLREAKPLLGVADGAVIRLVIGEGLSIVQATQRLTGLGPSQRPPERDLYIIGARVRSGLAVLAEAWWPELRRPGLRAYRNADARPLDVVEGELDRALVTAFVTPARRR